jgi:hypothetical protein
MTALKEYERLEATGLWRASPEDQRREVIVSIGEATLTISDFNDQALTHWSLAAVRRTNPGTRPAIFGPDGDPDETLELADSESDMIAAIEKVRHAIERARPRPGRLRLASVLATSAAVVAVLVFWLPGALQRQAVSVVPTIQRQVIGDALLGRIERVAGRACSTPETAAALARLAQRTGTRKLVVLREGVRNSLHLPGGIVLLNKSLIENYEDPAIAAGFILVENARAIRFDPLADLLEKGGASASFRLLTTGGLTEKTLDRYAETVLTAARPDLPADQTLRAFQNAAVPATPYAYALDGSGESVIALIEADPLKGTRPEPIMRDRDWVLLQGICGD